MKTFYPFLVLLLSSFWGVAQVFPSENMGPFVDGFVSSKLKDKNIAGAVVTILKDGELVIHKGYGYADLQNKKAVDPNQTLFRIGSVSKLFVWLAVMQQVEQGKLDLDRNINDYLTDFKIPDTFEDPITLRHIMSHTPGFEDRLIKLFSINQEDLKPLKEILPNEIPQRIRPAGAQAAYSNHATAIAAHIVEITSNMAWEDYVENYITNPLGMKNTTFRQPLPEVLQENMSKGYAFANGQMFEKPFEYIPLSPAGSVSTTANDMAIFMRMMLNKGKLNDTIIIRDSTFLSMLEPVIVHAPGVNACLHGFMDISRKGISIFGHGGDTFWFHSLLAIIPEQNMGVFASFNSAGGEGTYLDLLDALIDNFSAANDTLAPQVTLDEEYLNRFAGEYKMNRYPHSDYLKIISLLTRMKVSVVDGKLLINQGNEANLWIPIDNNSFRREFDSEFIKFKMNEDDVPQFAYLSTIAVFAFERIGPLEGQTLHALILFANLILSLIVIIYWPMVFFIRRRYIPKGGAPKVLPLSAKITQWVASFLIISFYIGFLLSTSGGPEAVVYSVPVALKYLLVIPILLIPLNLLQFYKMLAVWPLISTRLRSKLFYTLVCFIHIVALWQLYFWNLIGWNY